MFDIQRFADTVTSDGVVAVKFVFGDDDNRTVSIPDGRDDIASSEITALQSWVVTNNVLLGDKALDAVTGIESATYTYTTKIKLDLTLQPE